MSGPWLTPRSGSKRCSDAAEHSAPDALIYYAGPCVLAAPFERKLLETLSYARIACRVSVVMKVYPVSSGVLNVQSRAIDLVPLVFSITME